MALTKATYSMISGAPANVLDYGADPTGAADSAAAFTAAFAVSNMVYVPSGSYDLASTITLPPYGQIVGAGINNTTITATNDNVAFVLQFWSQLRELKVVKAGAHTKNLIEVGSTTLDAGRSVISDVWVQGAGVDGIQLIYGNLGLLQNVVSINNGLNGIRFLAGNGDLNAWTLQGYIDLRGNGNDGLRIEGGASVGDPLCSKSNFITGVTAQENAQFGVFIGTRSNLVSCYAEANTVGDVQLGTFARGNEINTTEGYVVDSSSNPSFNIVYNYNSSGGYQRIFQNQTLFSGVANAGLGIYNNDGTAGYLTLTKTGARAFAFTGENSSGNFTFAFNSAGGGLITTTFGGNTQPDADNAYNLGVPSFRWATVYAATGTINTSDERSKQDIENIDDAEKRVAQRIKGLIKKFRYTDAVEKKGDGARIHFGVVAQEVAQAFNSEGLDANNYGLFCFDEWYEVDGQSVEADDLGQYPDGAVKKDRFGIRYDELLAFIITSL